MRREELVPPDSTSGRRKVPCELFAMTKAQLPFFASFAFTTTTSNGDSSPCLNSTLTSTVVGISYFESLFVVTDISLPDLYGNDEADFASAVESHELKTEELKTEVPSETLASPTAKASEVKQESKATAIAPQPKSEYIESYGDLTATSTQSGPSQNAPQQIPTYQQPSDYSVDVSLAGSYDRSLVPERSVRPSEMKDEG